MARPLKERFDNLVDRSGEHHLWLGATRPDTGAGRFRVAGKHVPAHQVAWELERGAVRNGERIAPCPDVPTCVRIEHLRSNLATAPARPRGRHGTGSLRDLGDGLWELAVPAGTYDDGSRRREYRRVQAANRSEAATHLSAFAAEVAERGAAPRKADRSLTFDGAVEQFLTEHLAGELGREAKTVSDYRRLHLKWFSPHYGRRRLAEVDRAAIDASRSARRGHASNVVLLIETRPRRLAGYEVVATVTNSSSFGIADVAVHLRMLRGGDLRSSNRTVAEAVTFARRAVASGTSIELKFPHVARLPETSWELADDRGPGYVATLFWCDADKKRWKRAAGAAANRCRAKDFPSEI